MEDSKSMVIEKLNQDNWVNWKFKIKLICEDLNLFGILNGDEKGDKLNGKKLSAFVKKQKKLMRLIALNVDDQFLTLIRDTNDPKEAWDCLRQNFEKICLANQFNLRKQLLNIKYISGDMAKHINTIIDLKQKLEAIDQIVTDNDMVIALLQSLPTTYETLIVALESQFGSAKIDFNFVKGRVLEEYNRKLNLVKDNDENQVALMTNKLNINNNNKEQNKPMNNSKPKQKRYGKCNYCKQKGHWARECKKKQNDEEKVEVSSDTANVSALMVSIGTNNVDNWYIDSGASVHMTNNLKWFSDFKYIDNVPINLADDSNIRAIGTGIVALKVETRDGSNTINLLNVYYVPKLSKNLLSMSVASQNGAKFEIKPDHCLIRNGSNRLIIEAILVNGLYQIKNISNSYFQCYISDGPKVDETVLWHRRLGHCNTQSVAKLVKENKFKLSKQVNHDIVKGCESCLYGKQTRKSFEQSTSKTTECLDLIHSDICGPIPVASIGGNKYFQTFIDDFSKKTFVYFMKTRDQSQNIIIKFLKKVENIKNKTVKILRTDGAKEFTSKDVEDYLSANGIQHQLTVRYSPQQNGIAERMNRTIMETVRCMLHDANLTDEFWAEAVDTAVYLINRRPNSSINFQIPEEVWLSKSINYNEIKIFGCYCHAHVPKELRNKLESKTRKCIFLGYPENQKAFKVWDEVDGKLLVTRDVVFNDDIVTNYNDSANVCEPNIDLKPPTSFHELDKRADKKIWLKAAQQEMDSLIANKTWELVDHQKEMNVIDCRWIFTNKSNSDGTINRAKARLVAKGFKQIPFVDYDETFSPVSKLTSIRVVLCIAMVKRMILVQMDVRTAFLNGELTETVYMKQPEGFKKEEGKVCKLRKSIYGLKQAALVWYKEVDRTLKNIGFENLYNDTCIFKRKRESDEIFIILYVDDLLVLGSDEKCLSELQNQLMKKFVMKIIKDIEQFLGINMKWNRKESIIDLFQERYIKVILEKFQMSECKNVKTPYDGNINIAQGESQVEPQTDSFVTRYQSAIGSLNYLVTCTRPDLAIIVSILSQFNSKPEQHHWSAVKRVFRYLKSTKRLGIRLGSNKCMFNLHGFADADWGGNRIDRKSFTGYLFKLNENPISWNSKKQATVALSTTEAEYMSLTAATKEAIWLMRMLNELGLDISIVELFGDNQGALKLAKNPVYHARTKHIDIQYHFIRQAVENKLINLNYVSTNENLADLLTKPLPGPRFIKLSAEILTEID